MQRHRLSKASALSALAFLPLIACNPKGPAPDGTGNAAVAADPNIVTSKDATTIHFEQTGSGPTLILVAGALCDHNVLTPLAKLLSEHFTVINYDRRGRGQSGNALPYTVQREVEDIEALINRAGGSAYLFGVSSGAALALEAANQLPAKVSKLVIYEPPFLVDNSRPAIPLDFADRARDLVADGRRGDAVEYFMVEAVGVPAAQVGEMRKSPMWAGMEKLAHTLEYDGRIMEGTQSAKPLPDNRWKNVKARTVVMDGSASPPWMRNAARDAARVIPHATYRTLEGQDHGVAMMAPQILSPVLVEIFNAR